MLQEAQPKRPANLLASPGSRRRLARTSMMALPLFSHFIGAGWHSKFQRVRRTVSPKSGSGLPCSVFRSAMASGPKMHLCEKAATVARCRGAAQRASRGAGITPLPGRQVQPCQARSNRHSIAIRATAPRRPPAGASMRWRTCTFTIRRPMTAIMSPIRCHPCTEAVPPKGRA